MNRLVVSLLVFSALMFAAGHAVIAKDGAVVSEDLRLALSAKIASAGNALIATEWSVSAPGKRVQVMHTECYWGGGGVRGVALWALPPAEEQLLAVYVGDGATIGGRQRGSLKFIPDASTLNSRMTPWFEAASNSARDLGIEASRRRYSPVLSMELRDSDGAPELKYAVKAEPYAEPYSGIFAWLSPPYWAEVAASRPSNNRVRLEGNTFVGTLDSESGLPHSWHAHSPATGATIKGARVAPKWTVERWRREVDQLLASAPISSLERPLDYGLQLELMKDLLRDTLRAAPGLDPGSDDQLVLVRHFVTTARAVCPVLPRERRTSTPDERGNLMYVGTRIGAVFSAAARESGWSETDAFALGLMSFEFWRSLDEKLPSR